MLHDNPWLAIHGDGIKHSEVCHAPSKIKYIHTDAFPSTPYMYGGEMVYNVLFRIIAFIEPRASGRAFLCIFDCIYPN